MGKQNESYEVWTEKVGGKWTALSEEDGSIKLFPDQKLAKMSVSSYSREWTAPRVGKQNDSYEVWIEKVGGKWVALTDEDGSIRLFPDRAIAYTDSMSYSNEGTALRACIFRRILVEELNCGDRTISKTEGTVIRACIFRRILVEEVGCAGRAVARKMGLDRPNVHIEGGIKVGPPHKSQMFKKPPERV